MKKKHSQSQALGKETRRIGSYDYRSWDQFDVEKACKEIDKQGDASDQSSSDHEPDLSPVKRKMPVHSDVTSARPSDENSADTKSVDPDPKATEAQKLQNIDLAYFEKELVS